MLKVPADSETLPIRARSTESLTWEARPWPTCAMCYQYILLQMLRCDGLMEKDSRKLLWKSH